MAGTGAQLTIASGTAGTQIQALEDSRHPHVPCLKALGVSLEKGTFWGPALGREMGGQEAVPPHSSPPPAHTE